MKAGILMKKWRKKTQDNVLQQVNSYQPPNVYHGPPVVNNPPVAPVLANESPYNSNQQQQPNQITPNTASYQQSQQQAQNNYITPSADPNMNAQQPPLVQPPVQMTPQQPSAVNNFQPNLNASYPQTFAKTDTSSIRDISHKEINRLLPGALVKEIIYEKLVAFLMMFLGGITSVIAIAFIAIYYQIQANGPLWRFDENSVPLPGFMIVLLLITGSLFFFGVFNMNQIINEVNGYIVKKKQGQETIPYFMTHNYKKIAARQIIINWFAISAYIMAGITLGILYLINNFRGEQLKFLFWNIGTTPDVSSDIQTTIFFLIAVLFMHIFVLVLNKKRKSNIIGYYGYEIVPANELEAIRKKTHKICIIALAVVLIIITIIVLVPYLIKKKKKK